MTMLKIPLAFETQEEQNATDDYGSDSIFLSFPLPWNARALEERQEGRLKRDTFLKTWAGILSFENDRNINLQVRAIISPHKDQVQNLPRLLIHMDLQELDY